MNLIAVLLALVFVVTVFSFAFRFPLRHMIRDARTSRTGDFHWFELTNEDSEDTDYSGRTNLSGVRAISEAIKSNFPYLSRKVGSIIWTNDDSGTLRLYIGLTSHEENDVMGAVKSLAKSIGCSVKRVDGAPDIPTDGLVTAVRDRVTAIQAKDKPSTDGAVISGIADQLERLDKGERAAFIITMDSVRAWESKRLEGDIVKYSHQRSGEEASQMRGMDDAARIMTTDAVRTSIGATNSRGSHELSERILRSGTSGMTTLGYSLNYAAPDKSHAKSALIVGLAGLIPTVLLTLTQAIPPVLGILLGLVQIGVLVLSASNLDILSSKWFREALLRGEIVVPSYQIISLRYWLMSQHEWLARFAMPSCRQVIYVYPAPMYELVSFPSGTNGANVARSKSSSKGLPKHMLEVENGIYMGQDGFDQPILLDIKDISYSLYTAGAPNSGKTNFLQVIYAGCVRHSMTKTNGMSIAPIWGETKGEGAYDAWEIAQHHPEARFLDTHNPHATGRAGFRLAMEGRRLSEGATVKEVNSNSAALVNAMQYAYGSGIMSASKEVLRAAIGLSMLLDASDIEYLQIEEVVDPDAPNVIDLAFYLLGGDTSLNPGKRLMKLKEELDTKTNEREYYMDYFIGQLSRTLTEKTNSSVLSSSLNKLSDLREASLAWAPSKTKQSIYVGDIINSGAPTVINMGAYRTPGSKNFEPAVSDTVSQRMTRMALRLLWSYVKSNCSGWQAQGKRIPLFFDEVADIASGGENDDTTNVVADAMKEGRSRGLALFLGCQSPSQMPPSVRMQVLGARSKFWFNLHNAQDLKMAVEDLASGGDKQPYSQQNLREIDNGWCAGIMRRTTSDGSGTVTPPFTLRVPMAEKWAEALFDNVEVGDALVDYDEAMERGARV